MAAEKLAHLGKALFGKEIRSCLTVGVVCKPDGMISKVHCRVRAHAFQLSNVHRILRVLGICAVKHALPLPSGGVCILKVIYKQKVLGPEHGIRGVCQLVDVHSVLVDEGAALELRIRERPDALRSADRSRHKGGYACSRVGVKKALLPGRFGIERRHPASLLI